MVSRYRIKVFPYKGRLLYMPQEKIWWFWRDLIIDWYFSDLLLEAMATKDNCVDYIANCLRSQIDIICQRNTEAAFENSNPVFYINLED
jgi:hypothetical protein